MELIDFMIYLNDVGDSAITTKIVQPTYILREYLSPNKDWMARYNIIGRSPFQSTLALYNEGNIKMSQVSYGVGNTIGFIVVEKALREFILKLKKSEAENGLDASLYTYDWRNFRGPFEFTTEEQGLEWVYNTTSQKLVINKDMNQQPIVHAFEWHETVSRIEKVKQSDFSDEDLADVNIERNDLKRFNKFEEIYDATGMTITF